VPVDGPCEPTATNAALLVGPVAAIDETLSRNMEGAARTLGLELQILRASTEGDFDSVFATLVKLRAGGVVIYPDPLFTARNEQLAALAHRYVLPAISAREFAVAGGLMGYGPDVAHCQDTRPCYTADTARSRRQVIE
jgi:putative tryptophan/tyrosine transport system substrate-binding protein